MKQTRRIEHTVLNSLLRIKGVKGDPPVPFEKPSEKADFWVFELTGLPEPLTKWQARILPILRRHMRRLTEWRKPGIRFFLHVQTVAPVAMLPAVFEPALLKILSQIDCTLEHGVEIESAHRRRTRCRTVRREARRP